MHRARHVGFVFGGLLLAAAPALAGTIRVAWDPVPDAQGYRVYYGTVSGQYTQSLDVGPATETTLTGLADCTTHFVAVKAYNAAGESASFSNEISGWPRPVVGTIAPQAVMQGNQVSVTIRGSNFQGGLAVETDNPYVFFAGAAPATCTEIRATLTAEPMAPGLRAAPIGLFGLTVVNPDGVFGSRTAAYEVLINPARFDVDQRDPATRGRLDGRDTIWIARLFAARETDPLYQPDSDLDGDGWIDGNDLAYIASRLGQCWNGLQWSSSSCPESFQAP